MARHNRIPIKSARDIEKMREAGAVASSILQALAAQVTPGKTTGEIDRLAADLVREHDVKNVFFGYRGFPGQICISVNEEVVHGIGGTRVIQPGDVVSIDVGVMKQGFIGDNAVSVIAGEGSLENKKLLIATEQSLYEAIARVRAGARLYDVCGAVEEYCKPKGYGVVREFVGHGVGRQLHEEPQVPNYRPSGKSPILSAGMVLAIEPMINAGTAAVKILADGWTVITGDRKCSAHFEHTVLVTETGAEILTPRPRTALPEHFGLEADSLW